jgi:hypothetical protein
MKKVVVIVNPRELTSKHYDQVYGMALGQQVFHIPKECFHMLAFLIQWRLDGCICLGIQRGVRSV